MLQFVLLHVGIVTCLNVWMTIFTALTLLHLDNFMDPCVGASPNSSRPSPNMGKLTLHTVSKMQRHCGTYQDETYFFD